MLYEAPTSLIRPLSPYQTDDSPECSLHVEAEVARPQRVAVVVAERALVRVLALNMIDYFIT